MGRQNDASRLASSSPPERWWDPVAALLLLGVLTTAASRLYVTNWIDNLGITQTVTFLGLVVGLALGQSRFSKRTVWVMALLFTLFVVPWQVGLTFHGAVPWMERTGKLLGRVSIAVAYVLTDRPVRDALPFLFQMVALYWGLSVHAGYALTRHGRAWDTIIPAAVVVLFVQRYDGLVERRIWIVAIYFLLALALVAWMAYVRQRAHWERGRVQLPPYLGMDFARVIALGVVVLVLIAWTIPAVAEALPVAKQAWDKVTQPWDTVRERLNNAFASLRGATAVQTYDYYGSHLPLGFGTEQTDEVMLTVDAPPRTAESPPYYWRARVYDTYERGWNSTFTTTQFVTSTVPAEYAGVLGESRLVTFTFQTALPIATIYVVPQVLEVSHPVYVDMTPNPDGTVDLSALHAAPPLSTQAVYGIRSTLNDVTVADLRAASTDYPAWVTDRYLGLPDSITPRTLELAQQLAQGLDTPYDIAEAVTWYLRDTMTYNQVLPVNPPPGREPLDWFLFEQQEGFCNYYASVEVVLLRAVGIPARMAAGYAQGDRQPGTNTYVVRQLHSHAWPEVYFPGVGWVEFEPTVSQPPIERPLGGEGDTEGGAGRDGLDIEGSERIDPREEELLAMDEGVGEAEDVAVAEQRQAVPLWVPLTMVGVLTAAVVWRVRRRQGMPPLPILLSGGLQRIGIEPPQFVHQWSHRAVLTPLARSYAELNRALTLLGKPPKPSDTPAERAHNLARILPEALIPGRRLLAEYEATAYGPTPGDPYIAQHAARTIRNLAWQTAAQRFVAKMRKT
ncbi:MAG: transglutaminase domain-containing protein [Anaerolineae bacterium]|nr:transglutaminase domain-containing protein [Anaerolineae bacterium]